jgi:hypothetical protein
LNVFIIKKKLLARCQWLTPVILATQEAETGGSQFKASEGKYFVRPHSKKLITKKGWWSGSRCRP